MAILSSEGFDTGRDPFAGRIPLSLVTGFLGSGKTTLIKRLLTHPGMNNAALIINEFGEQSIDHDLLEASSEQMAVLDNGCLCCTVRTDLQETLRDLFTRRMKGEILQFDRVIVETTGLADPSPVVQTLASDTLLADRFRLDCVVTLADAVNGLANLDDFQEPLKQAAVADRIVITKTDIAAPETVAALRERLRLINPHALVTEAVNGDIDPSFLVDIGLASARAGHEVLRRWIGPLAAAGREAHVAAAASPHDPGVRSFCLWFDRPFTWTSFETSMQVLASLRGPDLLRMKGLVNIEGESGPVVVQGVQHIFSPPARLAAWGDSDHRSRIVFITRGIEQAAIAALFAAIGALETEQ
jgi:G3E family GTPase